MAGRIIWSRIGLASLITEAEAADIVDDHGTTLDEGNVGIGAEGIVLEGTRSEVLEWARGIVRELTEPARCDAGEHTPAEPGDLVTSCTECPARLTFTGPEPDDYTTED